MKQSILFILALTVLAGCSTSGHFVSEKDGIWVNAGSRGNDEFYYCTLEGAQKKPICVQPEYRGK